ncbi:histidine kinase [Gloeothece citriformis PCC 7424]|uniref:histidine kinase n=1 Tax=Gloeothece citriformis (strain PCC 7424) TaxID=65393 RepID=B7KDD8_GLOC7|nr:DICT sensory domain-containing protein [Gloeothece citriformis]ACK68958.1 histidine kinase [Gloeothece citriformis PCC 7424]
MIPSPLESSLYQLTQKMAGSPSPIAVSSTTFKSVIESLLDLLIEQQISATLWLKLPNSNYWAKKIDQYQQQVKEHHIYWCTVRQDQSSPSSDLNYSFLSNRVTSLVLETSSQLKREFFLILVSDQFSSLILAQHQCSKTPSDIKPKILNQSSSLKLIYSFSSDLIKPVLNQIKQWITITDNTPEELLVDSEIPLPKSPQSSLIEKLLLKQIQQTESLQSENTYISETQSTVRYLNDDLLFKDDILKSLAQEISLPLTNMKTGLRLLESMQSKREQRQRYITLLQRECERQTLILSGLQELIQLDQTSVVEIDPTLKLEDLIPGIVSTYQPLAEEKGISLGYTIPPGFPPVSCPENWLRQIVLNLLSNSLKFTPAKGRVFVQAHLKNDLIELTVTDTGMGIDNNEIPQIFKSFYRGRNAITENIPGAGLGLTIAQHLLDRCGGSISVTSQPSKGSTFTVSLSVFYSET